ncbi:MAG: potassium transporter Kup [Candidatus Limnocylindria bacterium]
MPSATASGDHRPSGGDGARAKAGVGAAALALGALGVVFGDIGTSPLYAMQTVFTADNHAVHTDPSEVYGVVSLVFWSIMMVVSVKYVTFVMRADNGGEGGIMALTALLQGATLRNARVKLVLITLGILGASLFYGDGVITPAISVLSAVEGLKVAAPSLDELVLPITVAVLTALFAIQRYGTGLVGRLFGPVMAVWFTVIGLVGIAEIAPHPEILKGLSPSYAVQFFGDHVGVAFVALGSVVLAVTGAEALYADMGQFGRSPIRRAWFLLVFPALTLNYLAQGSLILRSPESVQNPFYLLLPGWGQLPMVVLATVATVIASQAVISGVFSVTRQAVQLGFLPRMTIRHTSQQHEGRVYAPAANWALFVAVVALVVGFGSSTALGGAYGVAVTGTFLLNTVLFLAVARHMWHTRRRLIVLGAAVFGTIELAFFASTLLKVVHGGWVPLVIAAAIFTLMLTWHRGREIVISNRSRKEGSLRDFVTGWKTMQPPIERVPGTAVFLNADRRTTPMALQANVDHNHVLHETVVVMTIEVERVPHVPEEDRLTADDLGDPGDGITLLTARLGFHDEADIPATLRLAVAQRLLERHVDLDDASYFVSRSVLVRTSGRGMRSWRKRLFLAMWHNSASSIEYFRLAENRTVIMGEDVEL